MTSRHSIVTAALLVSGCCRKGGPLQAGQGRLKAPAALDFGQLYEGATPVKTASLGNGGNAQLSLTAAIAGDPRWSLASPAAIVLPEGGSTSVAVALRTDRLGPVEGTLAISGDAVAQIALSATILPDLPCPQSDPCHLQSFDPNQGRCVGAALPDGAACDDGDPCTASKACSAGLCKGVPVSCDDHNVCTTDYCQPGTGCEHLDRSADCAGTDPCQIYDCDPLRGCSASAASDGTPCAAAVACVQANVCLGGRCTGTPLVDGTPCLDAQDPCARDATCHSGVCHSPTADALQPGDLLWVDIAQAFRAPDGGEIPAVPDGGGGFVPGWRAAAATDEIGNMYLDDDAPDGGGDLVSLDVCGRERWRVPFASSSEWTNGRHILASGLLLTVAADQTLVAQSAATGTVLWRVDPRSLAGIDPATAVGFAIEDVALSADGVLYYSADWTAASADGGTSLERLLGAVLRNGASKLLELLPALPQGADGPSRFGYPLLVDENEELYTSMHLGSGAAEIESYDSQGALRWTLPIARDYLYSLSDEQGLFVEPVSLTAFDSQGRIAWAHTEPSTAVLPTGHSPVVTADGAITLMRFRLDPNGSGAGHGVVEAYGADGSPGWSYALGAGEWPMSSHVLDSQGLLYFVTSERHVAALDAASGGLAWQIALPTAGPIYNGVLALTPAGSLIASARRELFAIYAGAGLAKSPWPRFRGGNDNRSAPPPPSSTPPPAP